MFTDPNEEVDMLRNPIDYTKNQMRRTKFSAADRLI